MKSKSVYFNLPATQVFWSKLGKIPSAEKGTISAPGTASSGFSGGIVDPQPSTSMVRTRSHAKHKGVESLGNRSGLINCYKTESENGAFASFLIEFEGLLD